MPAVVCKSRSSCSDVLLLLVLLAVAEKFLAEVQLDAAVRPAIVDMCMHFHQHSKELAGEFLAKTGRITYVTPTSYLELIVAFKLALAQQREKLLAETEPKLPPLQAEVDGCSTKLSEARARLESSHAALAGLERGRRVRLVRPRAEGRGAPAGGGAGGQTGSLPGPATPPGPGKMGTPGSDDCEYFRILHYVRHLFDFWC